MTVRARTVMTSHHYVEIDGLEYETVYPVDESITPRVVDNGDGTHTMTYATHDDDAEAPDYADITIVITHAGYSSSHNADPDRTVAEMWETFNHDGEDGAEDRMREWLKENRGIENFETFSGRGYSQSDWWKGYAYAETDDPLPAVCEEFKSWAAGDAYGIVAETYQVSEDGTVEWMDCPDDCYWGVIGDNYAQQCVNEESGNVEIGGVA